MSIGAALMPTRIKNIPIYEYSLKISNMSNTIQNKKEHFTVTLVNIHIMKSIAKNQI